ncbi:MAG: hypothetical protein KGZ40_08650 [Clostridiales bacterium]|nr:hypothetical protein [Clostridiales bacterium]
MAVAILAVGIAGCTAVQEQVAEEVTEGIAGEVVGGNVEISGDGVTIETPEGQVAVGDSATLPDGFPADFPIPGDAVITSSTGTSSQGESAFWVNLTRPGTVTDAFEWYKTELPAAGWTIALEVAASQGAGNEATLQAEKDQLSATMSITEGAEGADIALVLMGGGP